ncbi:hypothetical protein [Shewanella surugensis]|uniref:Uncharacterized protein n=1 Tax=Shewanella surugensis TaxID=212020 RepID=A0ABT0LKA6_9GAMM|nr:hypothetical protein [Shewanella surugensis]MCL1127810.1 hypothetical protein [Shewanella surugensis]
MPEHPSCNDSFFAVDGTLPAERRQQILARLLTAFATGKKTNIGFDAKGGCAHGYIRIHRVG